MHNNSENQNDFGWKRPFISEIFSSESTFNAVGKKYVLQNCLLAKPFVTYLFPSSLFYLNLPLTFFPKHLKLVYAQGSIKFD